MKKTYLFLVVLFFATSIFAQTPEKISYQAVIRNSSDQLVINQGIGIKVSILQTTESGTPVYIELHNATTNANGLVSIEIGVGEVMDGNFSSIDWANDDYFIKTETDPTVAGGESYTITATSQLLSVPYALHAKTAETANYNMLTNLPLLNIANWDNAYVWGDHSTEGYLISFNETDPVFGTWDKSTGISIIESQITDLAHFTTADEIDPIYSASDAAGITNTDITNWDNKLDVELDADPSNEIQDLQLVDDTLFITNNTSATKIDLLPYKNNFQQTIFVAISGGDVTLVSSAIDMLLGTGSYAGQGALSPPPSASTSWVIEVKAGQFIEPGTTGGGGIIVIPDNVTVRGQGWNATELQVGGINMGGTKRALESIFINGTYDSSTVISINNGNDCYVREVKITASAPAPAIDMSNASFCEVIGNHIVCLGPMASKGIKTNSMYSSRIEDNMINLNHPAIASSVNGSYGISDNNSAMTKSCIIKNTISYVTTGVPGPGASFGIGLSGTGTARVSSNIFLDGTTTKDIINLSTGNFPAWSAPGVGEHGICNQHSDGTEVNGF